MKNRAREFLKIAIVPIVLLILFLCVIAIYHILGFPGESELIRMAEEQYAEHGYWVVLIGSLIEGLLVINWYMPGSVVAAFGVVFAREAGLNVFAVVGIIIAGFFATTLVNYALGKYGWYRLLLALGLKKPLEDMRVRVERSGLPIIFGTYFHPNVGALTATCAGILRFPIGTFTLYSGAALLVWNSFWGLVVYLVGPFLLKFLTLWTMAVVVSAWLLVLAVRFWRKRAVAPPVNIP